MGIRIEIEARLDKGEKQVSGTEGGRICEDPALRGRRERGRSVV
jgi:hypothetical protein